MRQAERKEGKMETKLQRYARGVFQTKTAKEGTYDDAVKLVNKMSPEQAAAVAEYSQNHALMGTAADIAILAAEHLLWRPKFDRQTSARNQWADPEMRARMVTGMKVKTKVMARKAKAEALAAKSA